MPSTAAQRTAPAAAAANAGNPHLALRYGPWAVVTGASDGIGQAFARHLAASGLHLVLVARREPRLQQLADELQQAHGEQCCAIAADLSDLAAVEQLVQATAALDVGLLVAAAGFGTSGPLLENDLRTETGMADLNCTSVLSQAWHFGQRFARRGRGGVVFMSSLLAFHGTPRAAHYAATKAYVQTLAEGLRVEWAPLGVDVIASAPGPIRSGFAAGLAVQAAGLVAGHVATLGPGAGDRPGDEGHDGAPAAAPHRGAAGLSWRLGRLC